MLLTQITYFVLGIVVTLIAVQSVRIVRQNRELKDQVAYLSSELRKFPDIAEFWSEVKKIGSAVNFIARGQQLATVIELGPKSLKVKPEDFEPNKEPIREVMHREIEKSLKIQEEGSWGPDTCAGITLSRSGFDSFVESETRRSAVQALQRLFANKDKQALHTLADDLVDQLCPEAVPV